MFFLNFTFSAKRYLLLLIVMVFSLQLSSQELPPVQYYSPQDYKADDQNWSISQDDNETIYVANNKGLLEYNGARWKLHQTSNRSIVRSVVAIDSLVYTGSYMDFGFWKRDNLGGLKYVSLLNKLKEDLLEDEEFWNIIPYNEFVLFQSLDRIYIFNTKDESFKIINSKINLYKIFMVANAIYFQEIGLGIFKLENGKPQLLSDNPIVKDNIVVNIFQNKGQLLFQTRDLGFFEFDGAAFNKWDTPSNQLLSKVSVYNSIRLRNGNFILGTISNGVIVLDRNGELLFQINRENGLANNTALSVFQDLRGHIWIGLDNGVAVFSLDSRYRVYNDLQGDLGTIYASEIADNNLYLGTNQGLFYRPLNSVENFKLIPSTRGQVWFLKKINGTLFCGHDSGTFTIQEDRAFKIVDKNGTWNIKKLPNATNLLISSDYNGLNILEKSNTGEWVFKNKIEGFDISSRYFEFVDTNKILVSHEYKGVFLLHLNEDYTRVLNYKKLDVKYGIGSSIVKFNGDILYALNEGIFKFNYASNNFEKTNLLSEYFNPKNYVSGKFVIDENNNRVWNFFKNHLTYLESGKLTDKPVSGSIDLPSTFRKSKPSYENLIHLADDTYLLGATNGYLVVDIGEPKEKEYIITIDNISYSEQLQTFQSIDLQTPISLKNKNKNLSFSYSVSDFMKLSPALYQYRLEGIYNSWSDWSTESEVLFENLPHGDYKFEVRAKLAGVQSSNTASFNFEIEKPWYLKPIAVFGYIILFLIVAALIQYFNRLYYKKQKKNIIKAKEKELEIKELETQQQIMAFKNETLQQDIENKSRELGLSTMTLIRKNEFLNGLKKELNALETTKELSKIIKIIDKNINNNEDWKFFEEAFNNADKDFLKKVKKKHPSLTPNDLKLCAYLRLNLASKEIAPLLNISHRSVEVKRYRLRKKMELPHEASLTNYILDI